MRAAFLCPLAASLVSVLAAPSKDIISMYKVDLSATDLTTATHSDTGTLYLYVSADGIFGQGTATISEASQASKTGTYMGAVYSSSDCSNATTWGAINYQGATNPWGGVYDQTDSSGNLIMSFQVEDSALDGTPIDISGKIFLLNDTAGEAHICGVINATSEQFWTYEATIASTTVVSGQDPTGTIKVYSGENSIFMHGDLYGLEPELTTTNCTGVGNACGVHIHSGSACDAPGVNSSDHYYDNALTTDPWVPIFYESTTTASAASFLGMGIASDSDTSGVADYLKNGVNAKPVVVHNAAGGRVGCGILGEVGRCGDADGTNGAGTTAIPSADCNINTANYMYNENAAGAFCDLLTCNATSADFGSCCTRNCTLVDLTGQVGVVLDSCFECVGFNPEDCRKALCLDGYAPYRSYGECTLATCYNGAVDQVGLSCACNMDYEGGGNWDTRYTYTEEKTGQASGSPLSCWPLADCPAGVAAEGDEYKYNETTYPGEIYPRCVQQDFLTRLWNWVKGLDKNEELILSGGVLLGAFSLLVYICDFRRDTGYMKEKRKRQRLARKAKLAKADDDDTSELPIRKLALMFCAVGIVMVIFIAVSPASEEQTAT